MNVSVKVNGYPSKSCWDILLRNRNINLVVALEERGKGITLVIWILPLRNMNVWLFRTFSQNQSSGQTKPTLPSIQSPKYNCFFMHRSVIRCYNSWLRHFHGHTHKMYLWNIKHLNLCRLKWWLYMAEVWFIRFHSQFNSVAFTVENVQWGGLYCRSGSSFFNWCFFKLENLLLESI